MPRKPARVRDGIVEKESYGIGSPKILWILKEFHDDHQDHDELVDSLRKYAKEGKLRKDWGYTWRKVAKVSYGLLHPTEPWGKWNSNSRIYVPALRSIAAINIKKTGGGRTSHWGEIEKAFSENEEILRIQIEECEPNVVIGGNTLWFFRKMLQWDITAPSRTSFDALSHNGAIWVHAYHPAATIVSDKAYSDLIRKAIGCVKTSGDSLSG